MRTASLRRLAAAGAAATLAATIGSLVGVGGAGAGSDVEPMRTGDVRSLSYNVAGLPEPLSGSEPAINTAIISPLLNGYGLVLTQENWADPEPPIDGFDFYYDDLISAVEHPYLSPPLTNPLGADPSRPSALVADGLNYISSYILGPVTHVAWPNCFGGLDTSDGGAADCAALKGFAVSQVELAPEVVVDVYNLHGEAGSTALDDEYRAEDFQVLAEYINANSAGRPIILGGDTNLHSEAPPDGPVWQEFLAATGLTDVCEVVSCANDHRIDKFAFRSGAGITLEPLSHNFEVEVFSRPSDGAPLSDHDALRVDWRWTAPPVQAPPPTTAPPTSTTVPPRPAAVSPRFTG
jgi:hypothetical protein